MLIILNQRFLSILSRNIKNSKEYDDAIRILPTGYAELVKEGIKDMAISSIEFGKPGFSTKFDTDLG